MADPVTILTFASKVAAGFLVGQVLRSIFKPDSPKAETPEFRSTKATRGDQLPLLVGRDLLAPLVLSEWNREVRLESQSTAGGKGVGAGGGGLTNEVFYASYLMGVCVGPAHRLLEIKYNGERIWPMPTSGGASEYPNGVRAHEAPSGTQFSTGRTASDPESPGPFRIYWGEEDQPVETDAFGPVGGGFPTQTRLPFVCYLYWPSLRLGGAGTLGNFQVDIESRPYNDNNRYGADGTDSYEDVVSVSGTNLGGTSDPWFRNARKIDEANCFDVLFYYVSSPNLPNNSIRIIGDASTELAAGAYLALKYEPGSVGGTELPIAYGRSYGATYDATSVFTAPDTVYQDRALETDALTYWAETATQGTESKAAPLTSGPPGVDPTNYHGVRYTSQGTFAAKTLKLTRDLAPGASGYLPPGGSTEEDFGDGFSWFEGYFHVSSLIIVEDHTATVALRSDATSSSLESGSVQIDWPGGNQGQPTLGTIQGDVTVTDFLNLGPRWCFLRFGLATGASSSVNTIDATDQIQVDVTFASVQGGLYGEMWLRKPDAPSAGGQFQPALRFAPYLSIQGTTVVETDFDLTGRVNFVGEVCPYVVDADGDAGANAAHILYQLMFDTDPHGLGLDPSCWDLTSLQAIATTLDTEGIRCHLIVEDYATVKERLSALMLEVGIDVTWDLVQGKYVFGLRRPAAPVTSVPQELMTKTVPARTRKLESDPTKTIVFTYKSASEEYQTRSIEADEHGNVQVAERSGVERDDLRTPRDVIAGQLIASRRASEEQSKTSITKFKLMRDAMTLRSNDVIDVSAITNDSLAHRILSVNVQPKSREVDVTAYPESFLLDEDPITFDVGGPSYFPVPITSDLSSGTFNTNEGIVVLRLPTDKRATQGVVLASEDGVSYWTVGSVPGVGGGYWTSTDVTNITFYTPVPMFTDAVPRADASNASSSVMRGATSRGEMFTFRSIVDLGGGVYRVEGCLRPTPVTLSDGDFVYVYRDGQVPPVRASLPVSAGRQFKVVPASSTSLGNAAAAPAMTEVDARTATEGEMPSGGLPGQVLVKSSSDDYDATWETQDPPEVQDGVGYYDVPENYFYVTFGQDGNWEAVRYRETDESTGPQSGTLPTTLNALKLLDYTEAGPPSPAP